MIECNFSFSFVNFVISSLYFKFFNPYWFISCFKELNLAFILFKSLSLSIILLYISLNSLSNISISVTKIFIFSFNSALFWFEFCIFTTFLFLSPKTVLYKTLYFWYICLNSSYFLVISKNINSFIWISSLIKFVFSSKRSLVLIIFSFLALISSILSLAWSVLLIIFFSMAFKSL